jgi:TPR repeat protein
VAALDAAAPDEAVGALWHALDASGDIDGRAVALAAAEQALQQGDLAQLGPCLQALVGLSDGLDSPLATLLAAAVRLAESTGGVLQGVPAAALRDSLESRASQGDRDAAYTLGRGLCGLPCEALPSAVFADQQNMRKGAAFLLRAADGGCDAAWLHLYRLHADHRLSVANPQLARFFLEKAALRGQAVAQRKLGALLLREASALAETEQAIGWLHQAAEQGDSHARTLLQSLVLPVASADGDGLADDEIDGETDAAFALEQVRRNDPWLASRLALARAFGLTKLEALCVDPVDGLRPWGLVVGRNPFISQARLSAPRAIPAVDDAALAVARRAAALFAQAAGEGAAAEGDLRNRSLRQRRLFERLGLDEAMFFSDATAMTLDALRLGTKWAHRARAPLSEALAA